MTTETQTRPANLTEALELLTTVMDAVEKAHEATDYDTMEIADIAKRYWRMKNMHDALKKQVTRLYHIVNSLDKGIFPAQLEKRDLDMVRVPELERSFSIRTNTSASMIDRDAGMKWLRENGHGDLIQDTVNAGTLASFARNLQIEHGIDLPDEIFKVTTFNSMGSAKYKPKDK